MNKTELIERVASSTELSKKTTRKVIEATIENIVGCLDMGGSVEIANFGTFSVYQRTARAGRNPRTGQPVKIASRFAVKFKASKQLNLEIN